MTFCVVKVLDAGDWMHLVDQQRVSGILTALKVIWHPIASLLQIKEILLNFELSYYLLFCYAIDRASL